LVAAILLTLAELAHVPAHPCHTLAACRRKPERRAAQLGHAKLSTTLEIYTVPLPAQQRKAVENLSRMVTNGDELEKIAEGLPVLTQQIQ